MDSVHLTPILTASAAFAWTMYGVELVQRVARNDRLAGRWLIFAAIALFAEASLPGAGALPFAVALASVAIALLCKRRATVTTTRDKVEHTERHEPAVPPTISEQTLSASLAMQDLRDPLSSMLSAIDATRSREDQHAGLQQLRAYGRQLASAMTDIEDLESLLREELDLAEDTYDLHQVLRNCVDEMAPLAIQREVHLRYDASATLPRWVVGDATRVGQLVTRLLQLATNRCTFGPIDISASSDKNQLHVALLNLHAGLEDPDGLGVTVANGLARAMGGQLQLRRRDEGGTEFHLQLPHVTAPEWEIELLDEDDVEADEPPLDRHRVQGEVLLVTDQQDHQRLFSKLLNEVGAETTVAATAELALHLLRERHFDLVLLDMETDARRGIRTVQELRARTVATPVLGMTGDRTAAFHERCLGAGCNGLLHKPVDAELLRGALTMHLAAAN